MKKITFIYLFLFAAFLKAQQTDLPDRIILNLTDEPSKSMAVTWHTKESHSASFVEFAEATNWVEFKDSVIKAPAFMNALNYKGNESFTYSAVLKNLKPNTLYVYRVGYDSVTSEWNQFKTASVSVKPFRFVYFGDPQNGIREDLARVFRKALTTAPDASFWLFAGDLTDLPDESMWEEWFDATGFIHKIVPSIMAIGNHDLYFEMVNGKKKKTDKYPLWQSLFTLPENGPEGMEESVYYIDYQGVRFIVLNTNYRLKDQADWLENVLSDNPNKWTIVTYHHPVYSTGEGRDNKDIRETFMPVFDKYNVDLVLQGHDHTYARTYKIFNGKISDDESKGTVYITSVSGPKQYPANPMYKDLIAKLGTFTQLFQVIDIRGDRLIYNSYTVTGEQYDHFELKK
ncbi:fibronectin type III domain-containing protein [Melioribacter sp. Ez-97]|uniref:fibronectin type III domain-containing protein n=1 Tax=Melioribacter sp. Ez-97 TaxID=3423434 RepID=UPI003ED84A0D